MASLMNRAQLDKRDEAEPKNATNKQMAELFAAISQKDNPFKKSKPKEKSLGEKLSFQKT